MLTTPSHPDATLSHYEHLAALSGQLLQLAQAHDWSAVVALSQQYHLAVEALRAVSSPNAANPAACQALLCKILNNDALLRDLAMPELARLSNILGTLKRQQSLHHTYGPHQSA